MGDSEQASQSGLFFHEDVYHSLCIISLGHVRDPQRTSPCVSSNKNNSLIKQKHKRSGPGVTAVENGGRSYHSRR